MAESVMEKARQMQGLIVARIQYFEDRCKALKEIFDIPSGTIESNDEAIRFAIKQILIDMSLDLAECVKSRLAVLRIPYQLDIVSSYESYLRDLRQTLNVYVYADRV